MQQQSGVFSFRDTEKSSDVEGQQLWTRAVAYAPQRRRTDDVDCADGHILPVHFRSNTKEKEEAVRTRSFKTWIHAIPLIIILCFLILWWLSHPVKPLRKGSKVIPIGELMLPRPRELDFILPNRDVKDWAISPAASSFPKKASNVNLEMNEFEVEAGACRDSTSTWLSRDEGTSIRTSSMTFRSWNNMTKVLGIKHLSMDSVNSDTTS